MTSEPAAVSIGTFDGVHLGHQTIIRKLKESGKQTALIAFTNPPITVLRKDIKPQLISSPSLKEFLLKEEGIDQVISLPFTNELAQLNYRDFIDQILEKFPHLQLILGKCAVFGKNREGTEDAIAKYAHTKGFGALYLEKTIYENLPISSSRIRLLIQEGKLSLAAKLLGRPYLLDPKLESCCLPPSGKYDVILLTPDGRKEANLTIQDGKIEPPNDALLISFDPNWTNPTLEKALCQRMSPAE